MNEKNINMISDDELDAVVGGSTAGLAGEAGEALEVNSSRIPFCCRNPKCGQVFYVKAGVPKAQCPFCKSTYEIKG